MDELSEGVVGNDSAGMKGLAAYGGDAVVLQVRQNGKPLEGVSLQVQHRVVHDRQGERAQEGPLRRRHSWRSRACDASVGYEVRKEGSGGYRRGSIGAGLGTGIVFLVVERDDDWGRGSGTLPSISSGDSLMLQHGPSPCTGDRLAPCAASPRALAADRFLAKPLPVFGVTNRKEANGSQRSEKVAYFKFKQAQRRNNGANGAVLEATLEAEKLVDKSFRFHVST
jgi:hypothetical protein